MKGIILAGGAGTRLHPLTISVSKQLMPIYDKPMIYYPLSTLMLAGINEILIITTPEDQHLFKRLLGDGTRLGCKFEYEVQAEPNGLAEAFIIGEEFIGDDRVALILGDNIFHGSNLSKTLQSLARQVGGEYVDGAVVFAHEVKDPKRFGVVEFDDERRVISIEEKPEYPKSNYAVPGLYFYNNDVVKYAKELEPSERGELEITALNEVYLKNNNLSAIKLDRGTAWLDTGTFESLTAASSFVKIIEEQQAYKIGCIEEVAWRMGWICDIDLIGLSEPLLKSGYGVYLRNLLK
jgi:glucose-1-phosphate thymidylyltransferase